MKKRNPLEEAIEFVFLAPIMAFAFAIGSLLCGILGSFMTLFDKPSNSPIRERRYNW
jgi:hypothetical protein